MADKPGNNETARKHEVDCLTLEQGKTYDSLIVTDWFDP